MKKYYRICMAFLLYYMLLFLCSCHISRVATGKTVTYHYFQVIEVDKDGNQTRSQVVHVP